MTSNIHLTTNKSCPKLLWISYNIKFYKDTTRSSWRCKKQGKVREGDWAFSIFNDKPNEVNQLCLDSKERYFAVLEELFLKDRAFLEGPVFLVSILSIVSFLLRKHIFFLLIGWLSLVSDCSLLSSSSESSLTKDWVRSSSSSYNHCPSRSVA